MWLGVELIIWPFWFTPRKKCQSDHEVQGPPKTCFKAYIITNMVQRVCGGRGKRCALVEKARAHGIEMFL